MASRAEDDLFLLACSESKPIVLLLEVLFMVTLAPVLTGVILKKRMRRRGLLASVRPQGDGYSW